MSDDVNILNGGVEQLNEIKAQLIKLDEVKTYNHELEAKQRQLSKDIAARDKAMDNEINSTVAERQAMVEKTYDEQISKTREKLKAVKSKRDKYKGTKVNERVTDETADLREQKRALKQDLKGVFTRQHISRIYNTEYFFSLFMPGGIKDFAVIFFTIVVVLAIPALVYFFLIPEVAKKIIVLVGMYAVVILLAIWIFSLIFKNVRTKNLSSFEEARTIRKKIKQTRRAISKKEKTIRKDTDESGYGLEKYDSEMVELDQEIGRIVNEKKQALTDFETQTKKNIIDEIKARYMTETDAMKAQNESAYDEQCEAESTIKNLELEISSKYTAYIGKAYLTVGTIDNLIEIINGGDAVTIADALTHYKQLQTEAKKD